MLELTDDPTITTNHAPAGATAPRARPRRDWQAASLIAGGITFAAGNLLHPLEHNDAAYDAATWQAAHLMIFFSLPLLILGLPVLHRQLVGRVSGRLATIAVAASVVGLIGQGVVRRGTGLVGLAAGRHAQARHRRQRQRRHRPAGLLQDRPHRAHDRPPWKARPAAERGLASGIAEGMPCPCGRLSSWNPWRIA